MLSQPRRGLNTPTGLRHRIIIITWYSVNPLLSSGNESQPNEHSSNKTIQYTGLWPDY